MSKQRIAPLFRLPIEYQATAKKLDDILVQELELIEGEKPIYPTIFDMSDDYRKLNVKALASTYCTEPKYIKDAKLLCSSDLPSTPFPKNMLELRNDINAETGFIDKYGFVDWTSLKFLNENSTFLQALSIYEISSPVLSLALPLILLIIPFFIMRVQGIAINMQQYIIVLKQVLSRHAIGGLFSIGSASWDKRVYIIISLVFYLAQVYYNFESCKKFISNFKIIHDRLETTEEYLKETSNVIKKLKSNIDKYEMKTMDNFRADLETTQNNIDRILLEHKRTTSYRFHPTKLGEIGFLMRNFYHLYNKEWVIGTIDYSLKLNSFVDNLRALQDLKTNGKVNECKISNKHTKLTKAFFPSHIHGHHISNNIELRKNLLVTGPNASGKTTILKTALINILLSQQFGNGCYEKARINPYTNFTCYINIPDTSGRDSLFQAEARQCMKIIKECESDERTLCIFDELFSGTNPYEAIGAATAVLEHLNKNKNVTYLITTHFLELCNKMDETNEVINLKMGSGVVDGEIKHSYKLTEGVSKVKGGIAVLKQLGYPKSVVERSKNVIDSLSL
jgi:hypothetical protein